MKSGSELRILKKGSSQPLLAKFDQADDEHLYIVVKNQQLALARADIDRLDARLGSKAGQKVKPESKVTTSDPDPTPRPAPAVPVPTTSYSSGVSIGGGKPDFETVYRRTAAQPK